jgi:hypothetical protein
MEQKFKIAKCQQSRDTQKWATQKFRAAKKKSPAKRKNVRNANIFAFRMFSAKNILRFAFAFRNVMLKAYAPK